ncbi:methylenetetrahydrofolate reductase-like protein, partial [Dinothrombium tinctorium]
MGRGLKSFASNSNCDINQFNSQLRSDAFTLAQRIKKYNESKDVPFFSMEFFPPQSADATINLISRLEKIREANPMFCDVTWHGTGTPDGKAQTSSLNVAGMMLNYCGITAMSHVTCVSVDKNSLHLYLERAKELGVRNVLALRGDKISEKNLKQRDFTYAADMVKYIRQNHGDFFTIGVAGYPCKHPEAESYEKDIQHLKEKVDCGADFIITQFFFESDSFIKFAKDCRQVGIKVPISAGIMPIQNYSSLKKIIRISGIEAPKHILDTVKENAAFTTRVQKYGIDLATDMCKQIIKSGSADGLHFYTLNNENSSVAVLKNLGLWHTGVQRPLPWLHIPSEKRFHEEVRPIFWRNRTKSYLFRTSEWNIFPKRKWSEYSSQSYKTLDENYYMCLGRTSYSPNELLEMWGKELSSEKDIWDVFYNY